jgi:protein tyrosine phosphatase
MHAFLLQIDDDPRNPAYIATQGPLASTVADFWQASFFLNSVDVDVVMLFIHVCQYI